MNSETKEEVAIKKIGNAFDNRIDAKRTLLEIKLLTHMDHDNVRSLYSIDLLMWWWWGGSGGVWWCVVVCGGVGWCGVVCGGV